MTWVWQNNGATFATTTAGDAVTLWNKNSAGNVLVLKSGAAGTVILTVSGTGVVIPAMTGVNSITFSGGQSLVGTTADVTELYRGTNPQTFSVFNTRTSATTNELAKHFWSGNEYGIYVTKGSVGGTARGFYLATDGTYIDQYVGGNAGGNKITRLTSTGLSITGSLTASVSLISPAWIPAGGTAAVTGALTISGATTGGNFNGADFFSTGSNGYRAAAGALFYWNTRSTLASTADGRMSLLKADTTTGSILDFSVAGTVQVLSTAGADTATLKANKLQITGLGAFASGDKYVIVDASGNFHISALGPVS